MKWLHPKGPQLVVFKPSSPIPEGCWCYWELIGVPFVATQKHIRYRPTKVLVEFSYNSVQISFNKLWAYLFETYLKRI
jgi:hypothetical protein